ncbi:MAG: TolC family protein [Candidatus Riflebacteria bacterium]|nr:TolC family protein [Candidatus Riflebacteria bacterium]
MKASFRKIGFLAILFFLFVKPVISGEKPLLSLVDSVKIGAAENLSLLISKLSEEEAKQNIQIKRKVFIPVLDFQTSRDNSNRLKFDNLISGKTFDGSQLGLKLSKREDFDGDSYDGKTLTFTLSRPLLRNFGKKINGVDVDLASLDYEIALESFKNDLNTLIFNIVKAWLDLFYAIKNLEVQESAYQRAYKQYEDTKGDIEKGVLPEQDIYLVEENVVGFEMNRQNAKYSISISENELARLLNFRVSSFSGFIASESLINDMSTISSFSDSLEIQKNNNPTLKMKSLALKKSLINLDLYKNQLLPLLNWNMQYVQDSEQNAPYQRSYNIGFEYSIPFSKRSDKASVVKGKINVREGELSIEEIEKNNEWNLKNNFDNLIYTFNILKEKKKATDLAKKKLDAQNDKYSNGISTLDEVVRFQRDLGNAMIDEINTLVSFNRLYYEKLFLEGTLYKRFGIELGS